MKKIILAAMSAGILSGCSSAPPLATPKGAFVDMNTDITSLLPHTEPVYSNVKIASVTSSSLSAVGAKTAMKQLTENGKKDVGKKEVIKSGLLPTTKPKDKALPKTTPIPLKGFDVPVVTTSSKAAVKESNGAIVKAVTPAPVASRNPFSGSAPVQPLKPTVNNHPFSVAPSKIAPVMKVWEIKKGTTLITGFTEWVDKEKCPSGDGKWKLQRLTDTDYPIDYPLTFTGQSFEDVTTQLFNLYRKTQAPIYVSGYRNQCLIVISDRK